MTTFPNPASSERTHQVTIRPTEPALSESDDPAVLRELLRQAQEQLRQYAGFEQVMADNAARPESLLAEASRIRTASTSTDPDIASALDSLRAHLADAVSALDDLQGKITAPPSIKYAAPDNVTSDLPPEPAETEAPTVGQPIRTDVLIHNIGSPALARSARAHLASQLGVTRADVRELAEGLLRITVEGHAALTSAAFGDWETERSRTVLTERLGILEIELTETS